MERETYADFQNIIEQLRQSEVKREIGQKELATAAEVKLLDVQSYEEYRARREAQPLLIVEPDLPLDEMTASDYCKAREREKTVKQSNVEMGTSYKDFQKQRENQNSTKEK